MNLKIKLGSGEIKMFIRFLEENGISYSIDNGSPNEVNAQGIEDSESIPYSGQLNEE